MKISKHKKKGMTLIEAIISVALLSIIIIPISGMIITATQSNKKAEVKQEASFIGQKLLEEIKVYDEINLNNTSVFKLLDGYEISKQDTDGEYLGEFKVDNFDVELKLTRDGKFTYDNNKSNSIIDEDKIDFSLKFLGGSNQIQYENNKQISSKKLSLKLTKDEGGKFEVINNIAESTPIELFSEKVTISNNSILITLDDKFQSIDTVLEVVNETNEQLNIFVKKSNITTGKIEVISSKGKVKVYNNISEGNKNQVGDLYHIEVMVSKGSNILFNGEGSSNVVINN